jgi:hypothetical protein
VAAESSDGRFDDGGRAHSVFERSGPRFASRKRVKTKK